MKRRVSTMVAAAFAAALIVAAAGSYAKAQTMGEYGATLNDSGVAAENGGMQQGELGQAPAETGSALDRPSPLESGNDPLSEAPSYLGNSGSDSQGGAEQGLNQPAEDSSGIPYAPSVQ